MMDMTMFNMMGLGAPMAMTDAGLQAPGAAGLKGNDDAEFVNLLDVAGDIEVGDFQNQNADEWMQSFIGQIQGNDSKIFESQKQNSIAGLGQNAQGQPEESISDAKGELLKSLEASSMLAGVIPAASQLQQAVLPKISEPKMNLNPEQIKVGQPVPSSRTAETQMLNEWAINSLGAEKILAQKASAENLPSAFAVGQWAQAVAEGDLKSVEISKDDEIPMLEKSGPAVSELLISKDSKSDVRRSAKVEEFLDKKLPEKSEKPEMKVNESAAKVANVPDSKINDKADQKAEGFVAFKAQDLPRVKADDRTVENRKTVTSKAAVAESSEPVSARDFMLNKEIGMTDHSAKLAPKTAPALASGEKLGQSSDQRVPHQAVEFVADKIDALKAAGGGTLRVHLDPKDLGSVMLKVSSKGGIAKVEIIADKPETAALLTQNKADLSNRLESSGFQAQLSIDQRSIGVASNAAPASVNRSSGMSSLDLVSLDRSSGSSGSSAPLTSNAVKSASASAGTQSAKSENAGSMGGDSWSRDERREFAREQWNASREEKKTA